MIVGRVSRWVQWLISAAVLLIGAAAAAAAVFFTHPYSALRSGLIIVIIILTAAGVVYSGFFRRSCRFRLTNEYIEFQSGILYQITRRIRRSSIMAVTEVRLPFPMPGISSLLISAMGGSMLLPLLKVEDVSQILQVLLPEQQDEGMAEQGNV